MKRTIAILTTAAVMMTALDAAAFFRPERAHARVDPPEPAETGSLKTDPCSLMIRYNPATVAEDLIHVHYAGTAECAGWWRVAITAVGPLAAERPKVTSMGPAEAPAPVFACAINVNFSAATASSPTVLYTGVGSCIATREAARSSAQRAVQQMCAVESIHPCR
jgi:hypothetical protein